MIGKDPRNRFSDRVENYIKYRPGYPVELIRFLVDAFSLASRSVVGDIGAGTGIFARYLLAQGVTVYGVEPNREMRRAAKQFLSEFSRFHSIDGSAEETGLDDHCLDAVAAAQAFHWFNPVKFRRECLRILKNTGPVGLIWNTRLTEETEFLAGYEQLLNTFATDYQQVNHAQLGDQDYRAFFGSDRFHHNTFPNIQEFDFEGLKGRLLSSSYAPLPGQHNYQPMMAALQNLFEKHRQKGKVQFLYRTHLIWGDLSSPD